MIEESPELCGGRAVRIRLVAKDARLFVSIGLTLPYVYIGYLNRKDVYKNHKIKV
jgi:hypothetical protein